jgi:50S ribosomal subunit-associated GTPase HflX
LHNSSPVQKIIQKNLKNLKSKISFRNESELKSQIPILGITGTGGAGKSSLTDELVRRFILDFPDKTYCYYFRRSFSKKNWRCTYWEIEFG